MEAGKYCQLPVLALLCFVAVKQNKEEKNVRTPNETNFLDFSAVFNRRADQGFEIVSRVATA